MLQDDTAVADTHCLHQCNLAFFLRDKGTLHEYDKQCRYNHSNDHHHLFDYIQRIRHSRKIIDEFRGRIHLVGVKQVFQLFNVFVYLRLVGITVKVYLHSQYIVCRQISKVKIFI